MTDIPTPTNKEEASRVFVKLVGRYGIKWGAEVPAEVYALMAECNKFLTAEDRRLIRSGQAVR